MTKDEVFSEPRRQIVDFAFDNTVVGVFPDMIRRSVPGYELVVPMTGLLVARQVAGHESPLVYDLGCSLGATSLAVLHSLEALGEQIPGLVIRAVDSSAAMIEGARKTVSDSRIEFIEADVRTLPLESCQAITLNWVMQFLPPAGRLSLLKTIRSSLKTDGILIVSEKVSFEDPATQSFSNGAHLDFKRANGYSELEISQKRTALEQVMITDTIDTHLNRFHEAGFGSARVWYQCLNWASFIVTP